MNSVCACAGACKDVHHKCTRETLLMNYLFCQINKYHNLNQFMCVASVTIKVESRCFSRT